MEKETIIEEPIIVANIHFDSPYLRGFDNYKSWVLEQSNKDWEERKRRILEAEPDV